MSQVMHQKHVDIAITAEESGRAFITAPQDLQVAFLIAMADEEATWTGMQSWPQQCRFITDEMPYSRKLEVGNLLKTLADHLLEP